MLKIGEHVVDDILEGGGVVLMCKTDTCTLFRRVLDGHDDDGEVIPHGVAVHRWYGYADIDTEEAPETGLCARAYIGTRMTMSHDNWRFA